ncbi:unnamed protein product, partial [marine sediment metagenome]
MSQGCSKGNYGKNMNKNKQNIDISLVNPFLGAAFDVFKQLFDCELKKGPISLKSNPTANY